MSLKSVCLCLLGPVMALVLLSASGVLPVPALTAQNLTGAFLAMFSFVFSSVWSLLSWGLPFFAAFYFSRLILRLRFQKDDTPFKSNKSAWICGAVTFLCVAVGLLYSPGPVFLSLIVIAVAIAALEKLDGNKPDRVKAAFWAVFFRLPTALLMAIAAMSFINAKTDYRGDLEDISYTIGMSDAEIQDMDSRFFDRMQYSFFGNDSKFRWLMTEGVRSRNISNFPGTLSIALKNDVSSILNCRRADGQIEVDTGFFGPNLTPAQKHAFMRVCAKRSSEF